NQDLRDRLRLFDGLFVVEKKISLVVNDAAQKLCTTLTARFPCFFHEVALPACLCFSFLAETVHLILQKITNFLN
ncbi:MAG: hypothetical protein LBQ43_01815, partial [Holosporales bacterium]|nr:hypothetical protein [Holosporales bacterium]